ncbi:MAG: DUF2812 domain-containing protein [Clostridia bacterium]|nr:DUF2812 domain-containing protein [Clostridia bacterium]
MKMCFKIHPDDFDKTANEEFYEKMASEGWLLKKRWSNLSQFEKAEPQKLKFDIYYSEYYSVSDEEKAEFEANGRTTVNVRSNVHVSYAPKNAALPPVIKSNMEAAEAIIPLKNKGAKHTALTLFIFLLAFLNTNIIRDISYNAFSSLPTFKNTLYKIITVPELYIAMFVLLAYIIFIFLYEHLRWKKAVKIFQNGDNPDDGSRKKIVYIFNLFVIIVAVIFISLSAYSNITRTEYETPHVSDGLYLDVQDFDIADKITDTGYHHGNEYSPNKITHVKTLSAQMWITHEHYDINDTSVIVFQDVIKYKSQKTALYAAELLVSEKSKNYKETTADGFEKVYISSEDIVAVIGNTTYRLTYITTEKSIVPTSEQLLDAILKKHNNSMNLSD